MQYKIYEGFFTEVEKKLARIIKKCQKYGNPFKYEVLGTEMKEVEEEIEDGRTVKNIYKFFIVEVEGTAKIDSWEFIATLEWNQAGNIIRRCNNDIEIPERFRTSENTCEHCNSKRDRKNLYIIHNIETNEWKQVGGSCLALYTGGLNAQYISSFWDGITELEGYDGCVGGHREVYYEVDEVLGYAVEVIEKLGYFNAESDCPTKYHVSNLLIFKEDLAKAIREINRTLEQHKISAYFTKKDFFKEGTEATVAAIKEYYLSLEDNTEFIHNIQVMMKEGYIRPKNIGFLCYCPEGYFKHIQKEVEKAKRLERGNEYFGEVGKRYKKMDIESVRYLTGYETQYGWTHIYEIQMKQDGVLYTLIWKSSKNIGCDYEEERERVTKMSFTVKDHKEYKGQKQTEVTRCKVEATEPKTKATAESIETNNKAMEEIDEAIRNAFGE